MKEREYFFPIGDRILSGQLGLYEKAKMKELGENQTSVRI